MEGASMTKSEEEPTIRQFKKALNEGSDTELDVMIRSIRESIIEDLKALLDSLTSKTPDLALRRQLQKKVDIRCKEINTPSPFEVLPKDWMELIFDEDDLEYLKGIIGDLES
ncbi:hypothetical protein GF354_02995 [Candidatus Peregrinibacteria bacterium]|nr:hypothetical protein [Candidatus Peregrinibacteria bacterium]